MATAIVKLPDGRRAKISIPDGMSKEDAAAQLQTMYDSSPEKFGAAPAAPAPEPEQQMQMPDRPVTPAPEPEQGMLSKLDQFGKKYIPPYGMTTGMLGAAQGQAPTTEMEAYGGGMTRALRDLGVGARQAFNKLTGDEEELARLNQEETASREKWSAMGQEFPISSEAGRLAGNIGAPAAAGAALAAAAPVGLGAGLTGAGGMGLRMLAGAAGGAAGGYSQPLTPEEEQSYTREKGAASGAVIGGAVPLATSGLSRFLRVKPDEALEDFTAKQLGASRAKGAAGAYKEAADVIEAKHGALKGKYLDMRDTAEAFDKVPVVLKASSRLDDDVINLSEEVSRGLSPTAKRVALAAQRGSTKTSAIVDPSGKPFQDYGKATLKEVRETIRELKAAQRAQPYNDAGIQQSLRLGSIIERLDDDLTRWAQGSDEAAAALSKVKEADKFYAAEVAPMSRVSKEPIGKFRKSSGDERAFDAGFMKPNQGQAMTDLLRRVPEVKGPAREIYGQKLLTTQGPTVKARNLEGGTLGEAVLSADERAYLRKVADAIKSSNEGGPLTQAAFKTLRQLPIAGRKMADFMEGVEKYKKDPKGGTIIADMLRAYAAGNVVEED